MEHLQRIQGPASVLEGFGHWPAGEPLDAAHATPAQSAAGPQAAPGAAPASALIDAAYDAWREADAQARAVIDEVRDKLFRHDRGVGEPPSSQLLRDVASRRHEANEKLARAIDLLHAAGLIQPAPKPAPTRRFGRLLRS